ncbi:Intraflagellar transport protein 46 [Cladochytrium tenue]|nr:Intraflagellar transport protein 46 [Cladochytrium tenue]
MKAEECANYGCLLIKSLTNNHFDETLELSDDEDEVTDGPENTPRSGALARNSSGTGANDRISKDSADQTRRGDSPPTKNLAESDEYDHSEDDDHLDDDDEDEEHDDEDDDELSGIRDPAPGASLTTLGAGERDGPFLLDDEDDPGLLTGDDEEDDEDEEDDDDDSMAGFADHGVGAGAGSPNFAAKDGQDVKDLFQYIQRYRPQDVELEPELKPFIPEYIPAIGDIDAFIKFHVVRPLVESLCRKHSVPYHSTSVWNGLGEILARLASISRAASKIRRHQPQQ